MRDRILSDEREEELYRLLELRRELSNKRLMARYKVSASVLARIASRGPALVPQRFNTTEERDYKNSARQKARTAVRLGNLKKQPCEKCGTEKAQMHHDDYDKPLDVRWLCAKCHRAHHDEMDRKFGEQYLQQVRV